MKKQIIILIFSAINLFNANAQNINWKWAKSAGGFDSDIGREVCIDIDDNIVIIGEFHSPTITFGTTTLINTNSAAPDIYIVKYDSSGNVIWAISEGGTAYDDAFDVDMDTSGNIIVTGIFESPLITFGTTTLINSGWADIFVVKYDSSGNVLWAKSAGGAFDDYGNGVSIDQMGNIFISGFFESSSINFGTSSLNNIDPGSADLFIVKFSPYGNVLWIKSAGGQSDDSMESISTDADGISLITGIFYSTSISFGATSLINAGLGDLFITKLDSSGNFIWAKSAGGISDDSGANIAIDGNGNVIVTGSFASPTITFGTITLINAYPFGSDIIVVKYDGSGNVLWAMSSGGDDTDMGLGIAIAADGNIFISGAFQSDTINFGSISLANVNSGTEDIFVVKFDPSGNIIWALKKGGTSYDRAQDISLDGSGNIIITGTFDSPFLSFGPITLTGQGFGDIYVAKLDSNMYTSVEEINVSNDQYTIYPNPNNGRFTIHHSENVESIEIKNLVGQMIYEDKPNYNNILIQLNEPGIYFIKLTIYNKSIIKKIIVQAY
jgi:hypothetical protein